MTHEGYVSLGYYGMSAGRNAFRFVVGHELGHVTSQNALLRSGSDKESNASYVAERIFGAFK